MHIVGDSSLKDREEKVASFRQAISSLKENINVDVEKGVPAGKQRLEKKKNTEKEESTIFSSVELKNLEERLELFKKQVYSDLSPMERITIARHAQRPKTKDYLSALCEESFIELAGDRTFGDDAAIIAGLGEIDSFPFVLVGHEKGGDTPSRIRRNFGMPHPEGFRKAKRVFALAEKFSLPLVLFVDTPGAYPGLEAEERGQAVAIAENIQFLMQLQTPIVVVIIGEASSGGALGTGVGDSIGMLEHAYYSVISPEGCASILWKDTRKIETAAKILKVHVEHLIEFNIIDDIIREPVGGAHHAPDEVFQKVKKYILQKRHSLVEIPIRTLVKQRYEKFRKMGVYHCSDAK